MHMKDKKYNVINKDVYKEGITAKSQEKNHCSWDLKQSLRKHKYNFTTDPIVNKIYQERSESMKIDQENKNGKTENMDTTVENGDIEYEKLKCENCEPEKKDVKEEDGEPETKKMKMETDEPVTKEIKIIEEHDPIE